MALTKEESKKVRVGWRWMTIISLPLSLVLTYPMIKYVNPEMTHAQIMHYLMTVSPMAIILGLVIVGASEILNR